MDHQQNPWQTESSHGSPWSSDNPSNQNNASVNVPQQPRAQAPTYSQPQDDRYSVPSQQHDTSPSWTNSNVTSELDPWSDSPSRNQFPSHSSRDEYQPPSGPPPSLLQQSAQSSSEGPRPALPPRRNDTDTARLLASQEDAGEQLEHMQQYESSKSLTQDERDQAELQKQFPTIDGSLIAAIYNDHKEGSGGRVDLASIRETLQELQS